MKLRIEKSSVKVRLSEAEIDLFVSNGALTETVKVTENNQFQYTIRVDSNGDKCGVLFESSGVTLTIPETRVEKWSNSSQIGIKETIVTDNGGEIVLTLEQDLPPRKHRKQ